MIFCILKEIWGDMKETLIIIILFGIWIKSSADHWPNSSARKYVMSVYGTAIRILSTREIDFLRKKLAAFLLHQLNKVWPPSKLTSPEFYILFPQLNWQQLPALILPWTPPQWYTFHMTSLSWNAPRVTIC